MLTEESKVVENEVVALENEQLFIEIPHKPYYCFFKRCFDIVCSFLGLCVLLLPLAIISLIIWIDSPGASPIFVQDRVGKNGKKFKFYKFRSMVPNAESMLDSLLDQNEMEGPAFKMREDPRITKIGKFIRKTSIDELPQLFNILLGDMSFVGPRPPLPREVDMYTECQAQRLKVIPGLTCYWQIQPRRNDLSFDEWLSLDLKYITERNFWVDIMVIFKTLGSVLGSHGE